MLHAMLFPVFVEFVGGPEQGLRRCFADVTNRGWGGGGGVCYVGYVACNVVHDVVCDAASCISISINPEITIY